MKYWTAAKEKGWCRKSYASHMRQVKRYASDPELVPEESGRPQKVPTHVMDEKVATFRRENPGATISHKCCEAMALEYLRDRMEKEGIVGPAPTLSHNTVGVPVLDRGGKIASKPRRTSPTGHVRPSTAAHPPLLACRSLL